ncbi:hypothetical protein SAMN02799622_05740 [Methylobacterium sp. UNC378MF]|nr:hypothetical protein SAMN02799622_05740 [Methylobacterium sp. UNC378MF]
MAAKERSAKRPRGEAKRDQSGDGTSPEAGNIAFQVEKISKMAARRGPDFFELAGALAIAKETHSKAFEDIISQAKISRRRAFYLLEVRERFQPYMRDAARLRAIGWTKLKVLAPVINTENADDLLATAETASAQKLSQILRGAVVSSKSRCVLLYLTPEQHDLYERMILAHGGKRRGRQLIDQERALMAIIDQVSARHD